MHDHQKKICNELESLRISGSPTTEIVVDKGAFYTAIGACTSNVKKNSVVVAADVVMVENLAEDVRQFRRLIEIDSNIYVLPETNTTKDQVTPEINSTRYKIFDATEFAGNIYFTSITSLLTPTPAPKRFRDHKLILNANEESWPPEKLARYLVALDYDNEVQVKQPGEFSWRGCVLDVFSPVNDYPIRIDYWGNTIESIRFFDPDLQRSIKDIKECVIIPCGPLLVRGNNEAFNFLSFFERKSLRLILCDRESIESHLDRYGNAQDLENWDHILRQDWEKVYLHDTGSSGRDFTGDTSYANSFYSLDFISTHILSDIEETSSVLHRQYLRTHLQRWAEDGYGFILCTAKQTIKDLFSTLLDESAGWDKRLLVCHDIELSCGVVFPKRKIVILSETDVSGKSKTRLKTRKKSSYRISQVIETVADLVVGDFAVHAAHGICRYVGLKTECFSDRIQEVLVLEFADDVKVLVPLDQSYLISRYVGASKRTPKLSRIGAGAWRNAKRAAVEAVNDLASELLRIQAVRNCSTGFSFVHCGENDVERFVELFPYEETEDQRKAIDQVMRDMERPQPMDRLICGDVGYGKTEVAMRAACKAVVCGKQVAILVPTTVLAQQHYLTFSERFSEFPIIIEPLSRFQNSAQQRKIIQGLAQGRVDIVIGTHRLLQTDIQFKDLGLIVIDEEQRFGVCDKEKLKRLRANVDILTLTATPIPRTLYMSMSGMRDMSTIMTAPLERLPVKTIVAQYEEDLVKNAITQEIQRGGQVFYLHNRVKTIYGVQEKLRSLLPEISIDVAHGQMHESELESAMIRFINGKTQVLLCTTIIESGMDIPNANTIIIDRSNQFGLAELYQLRGRVGRYHRQAYAYLLLAKNTIILDTAKQRLAAIRKFTQLGVGFKLALRDLEIRGAGNIVGPQQSGHISAIGFELYCQLMTEAVARLKHQPQPSRPEVNLDLDFLVFGKTTSETLCAEIPSEFVEDDDQRLLCYRRLSRFVDVAQVDDFLNEARDRFGAVPPAVINLLKVTKLKIIGGKKGIHTIAVRGQRVIIETKNGLYQAAGRTLPRLKSIEMGKRLDELIGLVTAIDCSVTAEANHPLRDARTSSSQSFSKQNTAVYAT